MVEQYQRHSRRYRAPNPDIGRTLNQLIVNEPISRNKFAQLTGISPSTLDKMARGVRAASPTLIVTICDRLRMAPEDPLRDTLLLQTAYATIANERKTGRLGHPELVDFSKPPTLELQDTQTRYTIMSIQRAYKLSLAELATISGYSKNFIERIYGGKISNSFVLIANICDNLEIPDEIKDKLLVKLAHEKIEEQKKLKNRSLLRRRSRTGQEEEDGL